MEKKLDLNGLVKEIDSRKQKLIPQGSNPNLGANAKHQFLYGLMTAVNGSTPTHATELIKEVDNKASIREGKLPVMKTSQQPIQSQLMPQQPRTVRGINEMDRDELMFQDLNRKSSNRTLADSLEDYTKGSMPQYPQQPMYPQQYPQQYQQQYPQQPMYQQPSGFINEQQIINQMMPMINETLVRSVMELYSADIIKKVLTENPKMLKEMVVEVIREIQQKNKEKK